MTASLNKSICIGPSKRSVYFLFWKFLSFFSEIIGFQNNTFIYFKHFKRSHVLRRRSKWTYPPLHLGRTYATNIIYARYFVENRFAHTYQVCWNIICHFQTLLRFRMERDSTDSIFDSFFFLYFAEIFLQLLTLMLYPIVSFAFCHVSNK